MSKANAYESDLLKLLFNGTAIADVADNDATSPLTNLYVSLHTADPGEAGDQTRARPRTRATRVWPWRARPAAGLCRGRLRPR